MKRMLYRKILTSVFVLLAILTLLPLCYSYDVRITWDKSPSAGVTGYNIYRSTESGSYGTGKKIGSVGQDVFEFLDTGLNKGMVYYYVVTAVNDSGLESDYSDEIAVSPSDYGDINDDGNVTPGDALLVLKIYDQSFSPNLAQEYSADMTHDGIITPMDALCVLKKFIREDDPSCE